MRLAGWKHRFRRFRLNGNGHTDPRTHGPTDGLTIIYRCDDASKNAPSNIQTWFPSRLLFCLRPRVGVKKENFKVSREIWDFKEKRAWCMHACSLPHAYQRKTANPNLLLHPSMQCVKQSIFLSKFSSFIYIICPDKIRTSKHHRCDVSPSF